MTATGIRFASPCSRLLLGWHARGRGDPTLTSPNPCLGARRTTPAWGVSVPLATVTVTGSPADSTTHQRWRVQHPRPHPGGKPVPRSRLRSGGGTGAVLGEGRRGVGLCPLWSDPAVAVGAGAPRRRCHLHLPSRVVQGLPCLFHPHVEVKSSVEKGARAVNFHRLPFP